MSWLLIVSSNSKYPYKAVKKILTAFGEFLHIIIVFIRRLAPGTYSIFFADPLSILIWSFSYPMVYSNLYLEYTVLSSFCSSAEITHTTDALSPAVDVCKSSIVTEVVCKYPFLNVAKSVLFFQELPNKE